MKEAVETDTGGAALAWGLLALAAGGAAAVVLGWAEAGRAPDRPQVIAGLAALAAAALAAWDAVRRVRGRRLPGRAGEVAGPLAWTTAAWILWRLLAPLSPHAFLVPAGLAAWLAVTAPPAVLGCVAAEVLLLEGGLAWHGLLTPAGAAADLAALVAAALALRLFVRGEAFRRRLRARLRSARARRDALAHARELGLVEDAVAGIGELPPLDALDGAGPVSLPAVHVVGESFRLQLDLVHRALSLTTAAILWLDPDKETTRLRGLASSRSDILPGPYPLGAGITGLFLKGRQEVALAPLRGDFSGLPYYRNRGGVGAAFAVRIPDEAGRAAFGILCVDRAAEHAWTETETGVLRLAARKLAVEIRLARMLQRMDRERGITERLCAGLRELNGALGAEAVLDAALKSAKVLVQADFAAVCLVEPDGGYRVARAVGPGAEGIEGRAFAAREGLVGQALRINRSLPVGGVRRGRAPVFGDRHGLPGYPSLRVIPLRHDDDAPVGALAVAARRPGAFHRVRREILELIAAQMAVKIDQARAHEEIRRMATSDGLTGLANHRTFQHAFDMMLARAGRRGGKMALILCDIDHFKRVNDTYGHPFGDRVLREVAGVLRGAVRKVDLAARYGGEEFAVLLEDADLGGARRLAERIRTGVARLRFPLEGREVRVSISLGIAVFPEDGHDKGVLVERADQALYQAKAGGRNRAVAWDDLRIPNPGAAPG